MAQNDFLTFAGDPAANVQTQAAFADPGYTPRVLGFSAGTALSVELNKVWRQASLIGHTIGQFAADYGGAMLDDGTPAGLTAMLTSFTAAVRTIAIQANVGDYLPLSGGTLTGPLTVDATSLTLNAPAGADAQVPLHREAGRGAYLLAYTGAAMRWATWVADATPEQGSNTGSNFAIGRYSDAGAYIDNPLAISRATGVVNFSQSPTVRGQPMSGAYLPLAGGVLTGQMTVGGTGIEYSGFYAGHHIAFGWDSNGLLAFFVDGTFIGEVATRAWVVGDISGNLGGYLPLSGGTLSGGLNINGPLWVANNSGFAGSVYFNGRGDFVNFYDGSRYLFRQWQSNWYDAWDNQTGQRAWSNSNSWIMTLDGSGNLWTNGYLHAVGGRIVAELSGTAAVSAYNTAAGVCTGFWTDGSGMWLGNMDGNGNPSGGHVLIANGGLATFYAGIQVDGNINATNDIWAGGSVIATGGTMFLTDPSYGAWWRCRPGEDTILSFANNSYLSWQSDGSVILVSRGIESFVVEGNQTLIAYSANCYKPGGGAWLASSDARLKQVTGDYEGGLDAICALRPIRYRYNADAGVEYIGLTGQEAEQVMPEIVGRRRGTLDGQIVDDLRTVDGGPLVYALINAVRELTARVASLEGGCDGRG